ncbi:MAG: hypothetical protein OJF49_003439 [Ktedonobacterales bacterium]|jgi:signal transduction histidine kinase|nr:MAG: hypothetical protein OJF49_003439 [Ktedonobacterales bacterium]
MSAILQPALAQIAIALSVFSLITYLWLGMTVLLIGNRTTKVTWASGLGLLMASLFFLCHGALVGSGVPVGASSADFWWHLLWVPSFAAPILWAATGLRYAWLTGTMRRWRVPALVIVGTFGGVTVLLALLSWPAIGHYGDFIRLLGASLRLRGSPQPLPATSPTLPALGLAFVIYMAGCAALPWASLAARRQTPTPAPKPETSLPSADGTQLWDAADAWGRARRALLGASLCMVAAGAVAALVGLASSLHERDALITGPSDGFGIRVPASPPGHVPLALVAADLVVQVALAGLGLLLGWSVVRQGVLVERRLPQRGFFRQWRGTAFVALVLAVVVAWMAAIAPEALPYLLVLVTVVTVTYALFTWQSYGEHDRLLTQLRPFVASLSVEHAGWLASDPREVERSIEALFTSLCRDVLGAAWARLSFTAGRLHRTLSYKAPDPLSAHRLDAREWTLPVIDERGVVARLVLGPRADGAGYTSADLEIARACGQRILDAVGEFAAAQAIVSLARRRGLEAELSAALPRRVLHDDVLPRLHLAMLRLEALRSRVARAVGVAAGPSTRATPPEGEADAEQPDAASELGEVVRELGRAHHDLAALMRASPAANPRRMEHGLAGALHSSLDGEFRGAFDAIDWQTTPEATAAADALPAITADLLLGAALEAVRNAGRHGRGGDLHRDLRLRVGLSADMGTVTVTVSDDGVGLQSEADRDTRAQPTAISAPEAHTNESLAAISSSRNAAPNGGTRTGLLTHGALISLVGGTLTVRSQPGAGTTVSVRVPRGM